MRYIEWLFLLAVGAAGTGLANLVGYGVGFGESLPGLAVMVGIVMLGVVCMKVLPLKLPIVAYCAIIGLITACPISYRCDLVGFSKGQERENSCKTAENQMKRKEKANENL